MSIPDAHEAAVAMNRARWGDTKLRRAAATVLERAELGEATRAELETIAGHPAQDGDDAA